MLILPFKARMAGFFYVQNTQVFDKAVDTLSNRKKKLFVTVDKEIFLTTLFIKFDFIYRYFGELI